MSRVPPHNLDAEESVLGALMLTRDSEIPERVFQTADASDFYRPSHGHVFQACRALWMDGDPVDPVTVAEVLTKEGLLDQCGGSAALVGLVARAPAMSAAPRHAKIVSDLSTYRRVIGLATELANRAYDTEGDSPADLIDEAVAELGGVDVSIDNMPDGVYQFDEFLDRPQEGRAEWAIPGLIRHGWRCILVAAEGVGKTTLFRQIGLAAAQGIHPLHFKPIPPINVLIVDLENPEDSIVDVCKPIRKVVRDKVDDDYDPDRAWLWWKPGGVDIRTRTDRSKLEAVVAHTQPDLVCLGPLYKAYSVSARENDELAAGEVMRVLDGLRTRYGFALMMEHHAPKGTGSTRAMMPYGSSLWLRWPEIGLSMTDAKGDGMVMDLGRWRGDRLENEWPEQLIRGEQARSVWPWTARWPDGTFLNQNERARDIRPEPIDDGYDDDEVPF